MPSSLRTSCIPLVLCLLSGFAPGAMAQGLGALTIRSHLGDYFRGEVLLQGDPLLAGEKCLRLTSDVPGADPDLPWLAGAIVTLSPDRTKITITSPHRIDEPAIQLALTVGCSNYMTRHYTVLLSPSGLVEPASPVVLTDASSRVEVATRPKMQDAGNVTPPRPKNAQTFRRQEGESIAGMARRLFPDNPSAQQRFLKRMITLNPEWLSAGTVEDVPPEKTTIRYRPSTPKKLANASPEPRSASTNTSAEPEKTPTDRLLISATPNEAPSPEKAAATLDAEISRSLVNINRDIGDLGRELANLRAEYKNPPLTSYALLLEMETRLARFELAAERIKLAMQVPQPEQVAVVIETASRPTPETSNVQAPVTLQPANPKAETAQVVSLNAAAPKVAVQESPGSSEVWIGLALLLMSGTTLGGYLVSKSSRQRVRMQQLADLKVNKLGTIFTPNSSVSTKAVDDISEAVTMIEDTDLPEHNYLSPVTEVIQLAEMFRVYKRNDGAVDVLEEFIAENPDKALLPSLHLLGMYRDFDDRGAFGKLARHLRTEFNIQEIDWDTPIDGILPDLSTDMTEPVVASQIRELPHIYERINSQWGSQECIDYLNNLLRDSRNGKRHGFTIPIVKEILFLVERLELELMPGAENMRSA